MLAYDFSLKCFDVLKNFTSNYMADFNKKDLYIKNVELPVELRQSLDEELDSYGLSGALNLLAFKRKNFTIPRIETVHIDFDSSIIHSSIVIPIENCNETYMFWMDGSYKTYTKFLPKGTPYQALQWLSVPKLIEKIEITTPMLCRVDIPHDAVSHINGLYRTILSIRIKGNPKFEDVMNCRYGHLNEKF